MTSPTGKTKVRRTLRKKAMGKKRKNVVRKTGTTPVTFALNKPTKAESDTKSGGGKKVTKAAPKKTATPKKTAAPKAAAKPAKAATAKPKTTAAKSK